MNWNQPICIPCWNERNPNRPPVTMRNAEYEQCAWCGLDTGSGIYVRAHPSTVDFPAPDEVELEEGDPLTGDPHVPDPAADAAALDRINYLLSAEQWPGSSGMEDVADIVRRTGRTEVVNTEGWRSH